MAGAVTSRRAFDGEAASQAALETGRRLLLVAPTEYDASVAKGVDSLLLDFDERGFFEKVVMVFPFTRHNRIVSPARTLDIHEFGVRGPSLWRQLTGPFHLLRTTLRVARLARREAASVVRANDPCLTGLIALSAARLSGKPVCVSIHADFDKRHELDSAGGAPRVFGSRGLAVAIERFVLSRVDMVLPIRESLVGYARRRGAQAAKIRVIPHGADLSAFTQPPDPGVTASLGLPCDRPVVSFAGRLSRENYVDDVLAAARLLSRSHPEVLVAIAGGGSEEARLRAVVDAEPALRHAIKFLGSQSRAAIAALRQRSAVALCPMGGFSLIEACAAGVPVVAYDAEWHRELVIDGVTGHLVREGSSEGLAAAVAALLDDEAGARAMGTRARAIALSRHDLETAAEAKRRCYRDLMESSAEGADDRRR